MQRKFIKLLLSLAITTEIISCSSEMPPANSVRAYYNHSSSDYKYCNAESCPQPTKFTLDDEEEVRPIYIAPPVIIVQDKLVEKLQVHYDFSKALLRKSDIVKLDKQFAKLKGKHLKIVITGYTDNVEATKKNSSFNQKLSIERAEAVKRFIVKHFGVNGSDITVSGKPLCCYITSNKSARGRAENRRAEVSIFITHN